MTEAPLFADLSWEKNRHTAKTSCWGFFKALLTINWKLICAGLFLHTGGKTSRVINTLLFLELSAACWWNAAHHMTLTYRGERGGSATVVYFDNGWEKNPSAVSWLCCITLWALGVYFSGFLFLPEALSRESSAGSRAVGRSFSSSWRRSLDRKPGLFFFSRMYIKVSDASGGISWRELQGLPSWTGWRHCIHCFFSFFFFH